VKDKRLKFTSSTTVERITEILRERELEREYRESALEDDSIWDNALLDGL